MSERAGLTASPAAPASLSPAGSGMKEGHVRRSLEVKPRREPYRPSSSPTTSVSPTHATLALAATAANDASSSSSGQTRTVTDCTTSTAVDAQPVQPLGLTREELLSRAAAAPRSKGIPPSWSLGSSASPYAMNATHSRSSSLLGTSPFATPRQQQPAAGLSSSGGMVGLTATGSTSSCTNATTNGVDTSPSPANVSATTACTSGGGAMPSPTRAALPESLIQQIRNTPYVQQQSRSSQQHRRTLSASAVSNGTPKITPSDGPLAAAVAAVASAEARRQQRRLMSSDNGGAESPGASATGLGIRLRATSTPQPASSSTPPSQLGAAAGGDVRPSRAPLSQHDAANAAGNSAAAQRLSSSPSSTTAPAVSYTLSPDGSDDDEDVEEALVGRRPVCSLPAGHNPSYALDSVLSINSINDLPLAGGWSGLAIHLRDAFSAVPSFSEVDKDVTVSSPGRSSGEAAASGGVTMRVKLAHMMQRDYLRRLLSMVLRRWLLFRAAAVARQRSSHHISPPKEKNSSPTQATRERSAAAALTRVTAARTSSSASSSRGLGGGLPAVDSAHANPLVTDSSRSSSAQTLESAGHQSQPSPPPAPHQPPQQQNCSSASSPTTAHALPLRTAAAASPTAVLRASTSPLPPWKPVAAGGLRSGSSGGEEERDSDEGAAAEAVGGRGGFVDDVREPKAAAKRRTAQGGSEIVRGSREGSREPLRSNRVGGGAGKMIHLTTEAPSSLQQHYEPTQLPLPYSRRSPPPPHHHPPYVSAASSTSRIASSTGAESTYNNHNSSSSNNNNASRSSGAGQLDSSLSIGAALSMRSMSLSSQQQPSQQQHTGLTPLQPPPSSAHPSAVSAANGGSLFGSSDASDFNSSGSSGPYNGRAGNGIAAAGLSGSSLPSPQQASAAAAALAAEPRRKSVVSQYLAGKPAVSLSPQQSSANLLTGAAGGPMDAHAPLQPQPHSRSQSDVGGSLLPRGAGAGAWGLGTPSGVSDSEERSMSSLSLCTPVGAKGPGLSYEEEMHGYGLAELFLREAEHRNAVQAREDRRRARLQRELSVTMDQLMMAALHHRSSERGLHPSLRASAAPSPMLTSHVNSDGEEGSEDEDLNEVYNTSGRSGVLQSGLGESFTRGSSSSVPALLSLSGVPSGATSRTNSLQSSQALPQYQPFPQQAVPPQQQQPASQPTRTRPRLSVAAVASVSRRLSPEGITVRVPAAVAGDGKGMGVSPPPPHPQQPNPQQQQQQQTRTSAPRDEPEEDEDEFLSYLSDDNAQRPSEKRRAVTAAAARTNHHQNGTHAHTDDEEEGADTVTGQSERSVHGLASTRQWVTQHLPEMTATESGSLEVSSGSVSVTQQNAQPCESPVAQQQQQRRRAT